MIGIITVYKSNNCGSFWQAYCLQEAIKGLGKECCMVKYSPPLSLSPEWYEIIHTLAAIIKFRPHVAHQNIIKWKKFSDSRRQLLPRQLELENVDEVIIGSDTLWNVKDYYFKAMISYYTGNSLRDKKFSTFGTSAGQAEITDYESIAENFKALENAKRICVRDKHTRAIIECFTKQIAELVCDPTLLFTSDFYKNLLDHYRVPVVQEKYLLLYIFGELDLNTINIIKKFAETYNIKIVSLANIRKWADYNIAAGPMEFIKYFSKAEYVVTDTFHGTVFSTIFYRKFIAIQRNKLKVNEYLESIGLSDKICKECNDLPELLQKEIDYGCVQEIMKKEREKSFLILADMVE